MPVVEVQSLSASFQLFAFGVSRYLANKGPKDFDYSAEFDIADELVSLFIVTKLIMQYIHLYCVNV